MVIKAGGMIRIISLCVECPTSIIPLHYLIHVSLSSVYINAVANIEQSIITNGVMSKSLRSSIAALLADFLVLQPERPG